MSLSLHETRRGRWRTPLRERTQQSGQRRHKCNLIFTCAAAFWSNCLVAPPPFSSHHPQDRRHRHRHRPPWSHALASWPGAACPHRSHRLLRIGGGGGEEKAEEAEEGRRTETYVAWSVDGALVQAMAAAAGAEARAHALPASRRRTGGRIHSPAGSSHSPASLAFTSSSIALLS